MLSAYYYYVTLYSQEQLFWLFPVTLSTLSLNSVPIHLVFLMHMIQLKNVLIKFYSPIIISVIRPFAYLILRYLSII